MARSLLRQLEQIRRAATYNDAVVNVNTSAVAEPTISGSLEEDTNILRTLLKQLKGTTNWYDDLGTYFDPTNTDASSSGTKQMSLNNVKGHTLDSKTIIVPVANDNSGSGYAVTTATSGILLSLSTQYATWTDRTGLPIFHSTANTGTYYDEGGLDRVCRIDIVNMDTDSEIADGSGNIIYAKFHDGEDYPTGSGTGTDVWAGFYADGSPTTMVSGVSNVMFVYPHRKTLTSMEEYEWLRTDFISSWEGDIELIEDIQNLQSYVGSTDGDDDPRPWTSTGASYILEADPDNLQLAVDTINDEVGSRLYTGTVATGYYLTDGDTITDSLDDLNVGLKDLSDSVTAGVGEKYIESVTTLINKNVEHPLPAAAGTYTIETTAGREGKNMDVYVDGQLLAADSNPGGTPLGDRDYGETSVSGVTFRFDIQVGRNITYVVRQ